MKLPSRLTLIRWLPASHGLRLSLTERATSRHYRKLLKDARASKRGDIESLERARDHEMYVLHQDREVMYTARLLRKARRLRVTLPPLDIRYEEEVPVYSDDWERSWDGEMYLSDTGIERLRAAIRKEKAARAEERAHWRAWGPTITGSVAALTGLVAVLRRAVLNRCARTVRHHT